MISKERLDLLFECRDGHLYWREARGRVTAGARAGSLDHGGYTVVRVDSKNYPAHRLIWMMHSGDWVLELDHRNGSKSDNRIENLRPATRAQNMANVGLTRRNRSGVKGVFWNKGTRCWSASIALDGRSKHLGLHKTIEDAAAAYAAAANEFRGEFARLA